MGAEGAVNVLYGKQIDGGQTRRRRRRARTRGSIARRSANPYVAAARGVIDDVIEPADTRAYLAAPSKCCGQARDASAEEARPDPAVIGAAWERRRSFGSEWYWR